MSDKFHVAELLAGGFVAAFIIALTGVNPSFLVLILGVGATVAFGFNRNFIPAAVMAIALWVIVPVWEPFLPAELQVIPNPYSVLDAQFGDEAQEATDT